MADEENHNIADILADIAETRAGIVFDIARLDEARASIASNTAEIDEMRAHIVARINEILVWKLKRGATGEEAREESHHLADILAGLDEARARMAASYMAFGDTLLEKAVKGKNYAGVHNFLKAHKEEVNSHLNLGRQYASLLTGLEWALWNKDWKMCALFFIHGADTDNNAFNGIVKTNGLLTDDEQHILDGFDAAVPQLTKGIAGLKVLPNDGREIGDAYLYIMERIHCGAIDLKADYGKLAGCVDVLANDLGYSSADLESLVIPSLAALRSMGLCRDTSLAIVERVVIDTLWSLLESFATKDLAADEAE